MLKNRTVTREVEETYDVICNKCEYSLKVYESVHDNGETYRDYEGLIAVRTSFGYHSKHFGDCTSIDFSLCEKCLWDLVQTFKIDCITDDW